MGSACRSWFSFEAVILRGGRLFSFTCSLLVAIVDCSESRSLLGKGLRDVRDEDSAEDGGTNGAD